VLRSPIAAILFLLVGTAVCVSLDDLAPKIPPGYKPDKTQDELGMWMELEEYETAVRQSALLLHDPEINDYVRSVACRVAGDYCDDLRIYIIRNPGFNASMTANGMMQVWTGLLVRVSSEDELAAVLGHELSHYTLLHTMERLRRVKKSMTAGSLVDLGVLVFTGLSVPVGQLAAAMDAMAFSRENEEEADLLGTRFMAEADYNPQAAARVWNMIVDEEESAAIKRSEPGLFSKTHPDSAARIVTLQNFVAENYGNTEDDPGSQERHVAMLNQYYLMLMEDQIDTNRFGRTKAILERHAEIGVEQSRVDFFYGEMFRQRAEEGDEALAKEAYFRATQADNPLPEASRNLGYLHLKEKNLEQAQYNFRQYLALNPDANDRAMIEFYLEE
jgi:predicted Zn-dependent protease